jgi:mannose-6-phosphate isomerase-like protein (cupin superfamily)
VVQPGQTTWKHRLKTSEVYYIMDGEGILHLDVDTARVRPGSTVYISPKAIQCILIQE